MKIESWDEVLPGDVTPLTMITIPTGVFMMGSPSPVTEYGRHEEEGPQRRVKVAPFSLSECLVTQGQWRIVAGMKKHKIEIKEEPSYFHGKEYNPVEQVSYLQAMEFCDRLSNYTGKAYRLPTEAEWEYACRGGTTSAYSFGDNLSEVLMNCDFEPTENPAELFSKYRGTSPVRAYPANPFGLYDMHGNVWEWCNGYYNEKQGEGGYKVIRGGSWLVKPESCRSDSRYPSDTWYNTHDLGFRVALTDNTVYSLSDSN